MRFRDVRRLLRQERGAALVMAIGVAMVLAIAGTSLIAYGTSNERAAHRFKRSHDSYQTAVSGIENGVAQLANGTVSDRGDPNYFASLAKTQAFDTNETVVWDGVLCDDNPNNPGATGDGCTEYTGTPSDTYIPNLRWRLTSTSSVPAESGPGTISRTVTADVRLRPETSIVRDEEAWEYVYSWKTGDPDGCDMELPNNPSVTSSFYVAGTLCLDNNSSVLGPTPGNPDVKVNVKGNAVLLKSGNDLGTIARPLTQIWVDGVFAPGYPLGGCKYRMRGYDNPCRTADHVEAVIPDPAPPISGPVISAPTAQFDDWYWVASPGPTQPCDPTLSSGAYPNFTDNGIVNDGDLGTLAIDDMASFSCVTLLGELTWNAATADLTIDGSIFWDGNMEIDPATALDITYDGIGVIYLSGWFRTRQTKICSTYSGGDCNYSTWNTDQDLFVVATAGQTNFSQCAACGIMLEQSSQFQGALYADWSMGFQNNSYVQGPMVAKEEVIQNSFTFNYIPPLIRVPFGMPSVTIDAWNILPPTNFTG